MRHRLAENDLKPWRQHMRCIPKVDAEYVARMEDVLDLYNEEPDPKQPVVCFDESPTQIVREMRGSIAAKSGQPQRFDREYRRKSMANFLVPLDAHNSWRKAKLIGQRAAADFALCLRDLADLYFPTVEKIRLVLPSRPTPRKILNLPRVSPQPEPIQLRADSLATMRP